MRPIIQQIYFNTIGDWAWGMEHGALGMGNWGLGIGKI
jgi:hypothetical protein